MNFLSHYYLDHLTATPPFVLGLVLPDLYSDFNRQLKRPILYNQGADLSLFSSTVRRGIERHLAADAVFHNSTFFREHVQYLTSRLDNQKVPSFQYRTYFLSHIILELVLDRLLMEHFPYFAVSFYAQLEALSREQVERFGWETGTDVEMQMFFTKLNKFIDDGYLFYYEDDMMLLNGIINIYTSLRVANPSVSERNTLLREIEDFRKKLAGYFIGAFQDMQTQLDQ